MAQKNTRLQPNSIPLSQLREAVDCDVASGKFTWRNRRNLPHKVNSRFAGKSAFETNSKGYRVATINGKKILAHRAVWAFAYGSWPKLELDHINGDRSDNRIENLRAVTFSENHKNTKMKRSNTSGYNGVSIIKETGRWRARAKVNGQIINLGVYSCATAAAVARKKADIDLGFHENHGRKA